MPGAPDPVQYTSRAAGCPADGTACALTLDIVISTITQRVVREAVRRRNLPNSVITQLLEGRQEVLQLAATTAVVRHKTSLLVSACHQEL